MPEEYHHYNKSLKQFARDHRNHSTRAEIKLWSKVLSRRKMMNYQFLRQRPIDNYIADFYCKDLKLIIETDGLTHEWEETIKKDKRKTDRLKELGYTIMRFTDDDVMKDIDNVLRTIVYFIETMEEKNPKLKILKERKVKHPPSDSHQ